MTVYVDNMRRRATVGRLRAIWSHLFADTPAELDDFARALGLRRSWLQHGGTHREHYDLVDAKRNEAITLGAESIVYPRDTGDLMNARREFVCRCKTLDTCEWGRIVGGPTP